jgi:hypothetical protein
VATPGARALLDLEPLCTIEAGLGPIVSLGPAQYGERRMVTILGGTVSGPGLQGEIVPGGADWQTVRADGVVDVEARYAICVPGGGIVGVLSQGYRHGPSEVMERLAAGERVPRTEYVFQTVMRFQTGARDWQHLNRTIALASGERTAESVRLDVYRLV